MEWFKNLFKKSKSENSLTQLVTIKLYKIQTLKGDNYTVTQDDMPGSCTQQSIRIRRDVIGTIVNFDIKTTTYLPMHRIDWIQDAGSVTMDASKL